jgi:hypothetical protein
VRERAELLETVCARAPLQLGDERPAKARVSGISGNDKRADLGDARAERRQCCAAYEAPATRCDDKSLGVGTQLDDPTWKTPSFLAMTIDQSVERLGVRGDRMTKRDGSLPF